MIVPPATHSPTWTRIVERCAYIVRTPSGCAIVTRLPQPPARGAAQVTTPGAAAMIAVPAGAGRSMPAWNRWPRGPNESPTGARRGQPSGMPARRGAARSKAIVAGPASPSTCSPAARWNLRTAYATRRPKRPSIAPDGKPCQASRAAAREPQRRVVRRAASFGSRVCASVPEEPPLQALQCRAQRSTPTSGWLSTAHSASGKRLLAWSFVPRATERTAPSHYGTLASLTQASS